MFVFNLSYMNQQFKISIQACILLLSLVRCSNDKMQSEDLIFQRGDLAPAENFTGNAWNKVLVANDTIYDAVVGDVYFETGARTNWHLHPSGQILVIIAGEGFHQIKGEPKQPLKKGDVVKCPPNVMHWHGASVGKGMSQM